MKSTIRFSAFLASALLAAPLFAEVERKEQGNLITEDVPEIPQRIIDRMMQYQNTRSVSFQEGSGPAVWHGRRRPPGGN